MKVKVNVFRLAHFLMSKIETESIFLIKYYTNTILKRKFRAFRPIFNKVKNGISHCIFKSFTEGFRVFFQAGKLIFFAKLLLFTSLIAVGFPKVWILSSPHIGIPYFKGSI